MSIVVLSVLTRSAVPEMDRPLSWARLRSGMLKVDRAPLETVRPY